MDDYETLVRKNARTRKILAIAMPALTALVVLGAVTAWWYVFLREDPAYKACVERGMAHYIEIGSYPALKYGPDAGRPSVDVAKARCNRSLMAFDHLDR